MRHNRIKLEKAGWEFIFSNPERGQKISIILKGQEQLFRKIRGGVEKYYAACIYSRF